MPISEEKLYNSRLLTPFLKLLKDRYPDIIIADILEYARIGAFDLRDENIWFTQAQVDRFYQKCVDLTGNKNLAREAGRLAASPGLLGVLRQQAFGLLSPLLVFKALGQLCAKLTRSCVYKSKQLSKLKVEVTATPAAGTREKPYQCLSRYGMFESIITGFHLDLPTIDHPECMFRGDSHCRYIISWKRDLAHWLSNIRIFISSASLLFLIFGLMFYPPKTFFFSVCALASLYFAASFAAESALRKQAFRSIETLQESASRMEWLLEANTRNAQLVHEIGRVLVNNRTVTDVLSNAIQAMERTLGFDSGAIMLVDETGQLLQIRESFGFSLSAVDVLESTSFNLDNPDSQGPFVMSFRERRPFIIENMVDTSSRLSDRSQQLIKLLDISSLLCCPIVIEDEPQGVLAIANQDSLKELTRSDLNLLLGIAPILGVALANAKLIEDLAERDRMLEEYNRKLEAEVDLRTKDLVEARDLAMAANQAKSHFLACTNHELRTPLHSVLGYTSLLKEELPATEYAELCSYTDLIEKNASVLMSMIDSILDLAKIEAGQMTLDLRPTYISALLDDLRLTIAPMIEFNNNSLILDNQLPGEYKILIDYNRLKQVLLNLLSNAAKFTENGIITLRSFSKPTQLCIEVEDTGVGIAEKDLQYIFSAFTQVKENHSRSSQGTGLGLTITKEFIELMGGNISVTSTPGKGSLFQVSLSQGSSR